MTETNNLDSYSRISINHVVHLETVQLVLLWALSLFVVRIKSQFLTLTFWLLSSTALFPSSTVPPFSSTVPPFSSTALYFSQEVETNDCSNTVSSPLSSLETKAW